MSSSWPRPIPKWFWPWVRWRLGLGEFKQFGPQKGPRPHTPWKVAPKWVWAYIKFRKIGAKAPPPVVDLIAPWRGMGVWITRMDHFAPEWLAELAEMGYKYVVVPTLWGRELESYPDGTRVTFEQIEEYKKAAHACGMKIIGSQWGAERSAEGARAEARLGATTCKNLGLDGWVINGEKNYEFNGTSGAYCREFRSLLPSTPLGFSPEPRLALDHEEMQRLGVCYMPQAYPLENRFDVEACAQVGVDFGWLPKNVVPLVQAYETNGERYPAERYRAQARVRGLPGLVLYAGNQNLVRQYWRELVV